MSVTINTWVNQEKNAFQIFNDLMASRLEEGEFKALAECLRLGLKRGEDSVRVKLPHGTYEANLVKAGESGNINVSFEPSKDFIEALNGDENDVFSQTDFDSVFTELYHDYVAYGFFYPNAPENKDRLVKAVKVLNLTDEEIE